MRRVLLTENAANEVMRIRENELGSYSDDKSAIADAFAELTTMINIARDCEEMANCTEGILHVMTVIEKYNGLLNTLSETNDKCEGMFEFVEKERGYDTDRDSAVCGVENELLERVFAKHPDIKEINVPANVDAITLTEAAAVLGVSVCELKEEINKERREKYEQDKL